MKYSKILVPLDGSELAEDAIEAALALAKTFGAPILVLGVLDLTAGMYDVYSEAFNPVDLKTQLESFLDAALSRAQARVEKDGVSCKRFLRVGVPHEEIAGVAREEGADLLVMTTHSRRGLSHLLLGSVAEKVVRTAPCDVLVVHPKEPSEKSD